MKGAVSERQVIGRVSSDPRESAAISSGRGRHAAGFPERRAKLRPPGPAVPLRGVDPFEGHQRHQPPTTSSMQQLPGRLFVVMVRSRL